MSKQAQSTHNRRPPSSGGADKAIAALGGGILAAGLGAPFPAALIGCLAGYYVGHLAEKNARERKQKND